MVLALGLPLEHEAGNWQRRELDRRGAPDYAAQQAALRIEYEFYRDHHGKQISSYALVKALKAEGYDISRRTIREWLQNNYDKPEEPPVKGDK
jgi:hypothetical protein